MREGATPHAPPAPASRAGARTLYAPAYGRGVFKSTDDGRTWTLKNDGLEPHQPFAWRLTRAQDGTLYVVVARRSERGRIGDADDGALYRSTDGAEHWTRMALPAGTNGPNGLAVDPADPRRLYLAAWGVATPGRVTRRLPRGAVGGGGGRPTGGGAVGRPGGRPRVPPAGGREPRAAPPPPPRHHGPHRPRRRSRRSAPSVSGRLGRGHSRRGHRRHRRRGRWGRWCQR